MSATSQKEANDDAQRHHRQKRNDRLVGSKASYLVHCLPVGILCTTEMAQPDQALIPDSGEHQANSDKTQNLTSTQKAKGHVKALIAEIDPEELACRIAEACMGVKRPAGISPKAALDQIDPEAAIDFRKAARSAARYIAECIDSGNQPS